MRMHQNHFQTPKQHPGMLRAMRHNARSVNVLHQLRSRSSAANALIDSAFGVSNSFGQMMPFTNLYHMLLQLALRALQKHMI